MSDNLPTSRSFGLLITAALTAALVIAGCYRQSKDEQVPVTVDDAPAAIASDADEADVDSRYAVRILELRCYRIQEGRRVGERIRDFFAYSLVDQEAMEHYQHEFGNPGRLRDEETASAADDDVTCEYAPSVNRDYTILVDDKPVGLSSTDSSGRLHMENLEVGEDSTVVAIDTVTGERVVVTSPDELPAPAFESEEEDPASRAVGTPAPAPAESNDGPLDDNTRSEDVDFSDVPPGDPFDDEGPLDDLPGDQAE